MGSRIRRWPRRAPLVIYCLRSLPSTSAAPTRFPRPSHALPTRFATRAADGAPRRAPRRARAARRSRPRAPVRSTPRLRRGTLRAYDAARYAPRVQRGALFVAAGFSAGGFVQALVGAQHGAVARGGRVRRARRPAADRGAAGVRAVAVQARARARRVLPQTWHLRWVRVSQACRAGGAAGSARRAAPDVQRSARTHQRRTRLRGRGWRTRRRAAGGA